MCPVDAEVLTPVTMYSSLWNMEVTFPGTMEQFLLLLLGALLVAFLELESPVMPNPSPKE